MPFEILRLTTNWRGSKRMWSGIAARAKSPAEAAPPLEFSRNNYIAEGAHRPDYKKMFSLPRTGFRVAEIERGGRSRGSRKQYDVASRLRHPLHPRRRKASPRRSGPSCNRRLIPRRAGADTETHAILARIFDPAVGRFMTSSPTVRSTVNRAIDAAKSKTFGCRQRDAIGSMSWKKRFVLPQIISSARRIGSTAPEI